MKRLIGFVLMLLVLALVLESVALGGAWLLRRQGKYDQEIRWLETLQPVLIWERNLDAQLDNLYRERIQRELEADRIDRAVRELRVARVRARVRGRKLGRELMAIGIEAYARASDRMERHGQLTRAADWDDSLFVFAIRAEEPHHRYAALAALLESLDLRVRTGKPCEALGRVEWAERGLGGVVPGLQENVKEDLEIQCLQSLRRRRG
jgi:hypothetical protein